MNGAFEDKNQYGGHYMLNDSNYDDRRHYYDNVVEEDMIYSHHDFYDYGPRYHDNHEEDRGVQYNGHDFFFI